MRYDAPTRRRLRVAARLARSTMDRRSFPTARVVPAYWWDGHPNFGDALTPWLLRAQGVVPILVPPARAQMVGVGSILEHLPPEFSGVVWGTGLIHDRPFRLPRARFLAVRGALTRERLGLDGDVALGDAGLLTPTVIARPQVTWELGVVPHSDHHDDPVLHRLLARHPDTMRFIDVRNGPDRVVREIASCAAVLSTSLHGLVVADAYGIPALWATLERDLMGFTFKFQDHESTVTPGRSRRIHLDDGTTVAALVAASRRADPDCVSESVARLGAAVDELPGTRDLPLLAWRHR